MHVDSSRPPEPQPDSRVVRGLAPLPDRFVVCSGRRCVADRANGVAELGIHIGYVQQDGEAGAQAAQEGEKKELVAAVRREEARHESEVVDRGHHLFGGEPLERGKAPISARVRVSGARDLGRRRRPLPVVPERRGEHRPQGCGGTGTDALILLLERQALDPQIQSGEVHGIGDRRGCKVPVPGALLDVAKSRPADRCVGERANHDESPVGAVQPPLDLDVFARACAPETPDEVLGLLRVVEDVEASRPRSGRVQQLAVVD